MKTATIAQTKSHLSSLIADVAAGDEVLITCRGKPVARLVSETKPGGFGWYELRQWASGQPAQGLTVAQMREQDLL